MDLTRRYFGLKKLITAVEGRDYRAEMAYTRIKDLAKDFEVSVCQKLDQLLEKTQDSIFC